MGENLRRMLLPEFMPHGYCWKWEPWVVWTNVVPDLLIFVSYTIIGASLIKVASARKDVISNPVIALFGAFIFFCGLTHALEVYNTWNGLFRLAGLVKAVTALVSILAVGPLLAILPKLMAVPALAEVLSLNAALSREQQEKRRVAGQLKESQDRFRLLVEGCSEHGIFLVDPEGRVTSWNPGAARITGYSDQEILGRENVIFYLPEAAQAGEPRQVLDQAAACGRTSLEGWRLRKDGGRFLASVVVTALRDGEAQLQGFSVVVQDITRQHAREEALRDLAEHLEDQVRARVRDLRGSQTRLEAFIRHSPAAIAFVGADGRYLLINAGMEAILQAPAEAVLGRRVEDLAVRPPCLLDGGPGLDKGGQAEGAWAHADGTLHHYLVTAFPLEDARGPGRARGLIATDITERKLADTALLERQKLEALGVLAGGVAHDFNNLLGAMRGNLQLATVDPLPAEPSAHLETLAGLMDRAADLLGQILTYTGRSAVALARTDLNQLVTDLTDLLATSISKKARVCLDLDPALPAIEADPGQLTQVVMNLVINASEALGDRSGTITVRTRPETLPQAGIEALDPVQPLREGPYASLWVDDTGPGMAPEVLKRIFEPFFTTKFTGRGLGLAAVHGIVRGHQGGMRVRSEPGRGSSFQVLLPAAGRGLAAGEAPRPGAPRASLEPGRGGKVLVVDDEPAMRGVMAKALARSGFDVVEAGDGQEALAQFRRHREGLGLILMDLTMPVMDGVEACRELRRMGATVPVLLSSGYSESEARQRFDGLGLAGFLKKPFDLASLVDRARALLAP